MTLRKITPGQHASEYRLVRLAGGVYSIRSVAHQETFHPVIGPAAEAENLYVRQLHLAERVARAEDDFVIWDVGLGAAANAIAALRSGRGSRARLRLISFDQTLEPLRFALQHAAELAYFADYETAAQLLANTGTAHWTDLNHEVHWTYLPGDFPTLLAHPANQPPRVPATPPPHIPAPNAILYDAYSPARNPEMWTLPLFRRIYQRLRPDRPCALATYSRSTLLRVTLLLAGFFVGSGHATGEKEETTVAANDLNLIANPLPRAWLNRARRSTSSEPLTDAAYRQAPMSPTTWEQLQEHPQFQ